MQLLAHLDDQQSQKYPLGIYRLPEVGDPLRVLMRLNPQS